jgi:S-DNA-T family DNA segregation ATPase FtsK/SpoIIIE
VGVARKRKRPDKSGRFRSEAIGVVCLATAALFTVALVSYRAIDPNPFDFAGRGPAENWAGVVGATISAISYQLIGLGAWLIVVMLAFVGWAKLRNRQLDAPGSKLIGYALLLLTSCALLAFVLADVELGGERTGAGGLIGEVIAGLLTSVFGPVGGPLVATTGALLSLIVATRLSFGRLLAAAWRSFLDTLRRARTAFARRREQRRKARRRRTVVGKHAARQADREKRDAKAEKKKQPRRDPKETVVKVKVPVTLNHVDPELPAPAPAPKDEPRITPPAAQAPAPLPFEQPAGPHGAYALPDVDLLDPVVAQADLEESEFMEKARAISDKGAEFNVNGEIVAIHPGPVVTTYEFRPSPGVKYSRIINLEEDLSLALKAESIRIARLPGKSTVGIEAPNSKRQIIRLRSVMESKEFQGSRSKLSLALGKEIHGENIVTDLARMPHLLIAGTTGSGKSVALNSMLLSLLYEATPDEVKMVLVDPKRLEFGLYEDIPHLLTPVVVDSDRAANALNWAVREMDKRYRTLAEFGVRNIEQFNLLLSRGQEELESRHSGAAGSIPVEELKPLPYIVVIIDELADLMIFASTVVETAITRLSQMARAVGIHLIIATQRPSVDVITGTIKNNLPARISFRVASKVDSRVILDTHGAENLLGKGDMLFLAPGTSRLQRVHGAYVDEDEVKRVVEFWRGQARPDYESEVTKPPPEEALDAPGTDRGDRDEYYEEALQLVLAAGEASISNIQRKLRLGYARAGRIVDMMEEEGIVGPPEGSKPRKLLVDAAYLQRLGTPGS